MKKFILMAVMALSSLAASAQLYVGGSVDLSLRDTKVGKADSYSTTFFGVAPEIGYNINKEFAVGLGIGYNTTKVGNADAVGDFFVSPYLRYTFFHGRPCNVFADAFFRYDSYDPGSNGWELGIRPGLAFNLGANWTMTATTTLFSYGQAGEDPNKVKTTTFKFTPSNVALGFYYNF